VPLHPSVDRRHRLPDLARAVEVPLSSGPSIIGSPPLG